MALTCMQSFRVKCNSKPEQAYPVIRRSSLSLDVPAFRQYQHTAKALHVPSASAAR